jgi:deoxyribodipyrimidine photo-lyase
MTVDEQHAAGVAVGKNYPAPIVDHAAARTRTLEICGAVRKK